MNNLKRKVFSGFIWKFSERMLAQLVSFIVSIVLARLLTPDDYGLVAMVLVFINIADVFVNSGFSTALIQDKNADDIDFSTLFYCSLLCSIVIYFILFFGAPGIAKFYSNTDLVFLIRIFSLKIPMSAYNSIQHAYISRHMLFKKFFFSTLFGTLLSGIAGIIFAYMGAGVWALVAQYFTNTIIDTIILSITINWHPKMEFSFKRAKRLMNYGYKVMLADLSGTFFGQFRSLIIGKVYTGADLAYYNKGTQFPNLISTNVSSTVMTVLFPAISNYSNDIVKVKNLTRKSLQMTAYIMMPLLFGLAVIAPELVLILLTDKWLECVPYIQIFCIGSIFGLLGITSLQTIKSIGRGDIVFKLEFVKKPVYLILLIIGVKINVLAIALTMVIYDAYGTFINAYYLQKIVNYKIKEQIEDLFLPVILSLIMAALTFSTKFIFDDYYILIISKIIVGIFTYVFCSYIFKIDSFTYLKSIIKNYLNKKL